MGEHQQPVRWAETALVTLTGFALIGVAGAFLWLLDGDSGMLPFPVLILLTQWFFSRHRFWGAGVAAGVVGTAGGVLLLEPLRDQFDRLAADALLVAFMLVIAMITFTLGTRLRKAKRTLPS
ncbi:hypothetical protein ACVNF4_06695 [Streptomyces sp. S6]